MITIGVDIGGTFTRVAAVDDTSQIVASRLGDTADTFVDTLLRAVGDVREEARRHSRNVEAIGLALPGIVDRERRVLVRGVNVAALENRPLAKELTERTGLRCTLVTDAEAATWAEYTARTPRPARFVHLRLGTGVACGVVIDGALLRLDTDRRTHLEVLVVEKGPHARRCVCGLTGCLETVASGKAIEKRARQAGYARGIVDLQVGAERGEAAARVLYGEVTIALDRAVSNLTERFDPELICLGGGVVQARPDLAEAVGRRGGTSGRAHVSLPSASIVPALHGDNAGVIGAALLSRDKWPAITDDGGL